MAEPQDMAVEQLDAASGECSFVHAPAAPQASPATLVTISHVPKNS